MTVNHDYPLKDKGASNTTDSLLLPRHRWYSYKEGFSPSLLDHAVQNLKHFDSKRDLIFDPFNGSGTVTLFSSLKGYKSLGYEVNPFSSFISRVKEVTLSQKDEDAFNREKDNLIKHCKKQRKSPLLTFSTFSEGEGKDKWLFNSSVLNTFEGGHSYLKNVQSTKVRDLLKLSLINSAMDNCNAKKDGKCLRYKEDWKTLKYNAESFINSIENNIALYLNDIRQSKVLKKSRIHTGDARKLVMDTSEKFKLCITSPPYLNSFDYTDIYRPELFLGNFLLTQKQLYNLRFKTLRSHVNHIDSFNPKKTFGANYDKTILAINESSSSLWHSKIPSMIQSYFEDMKSMFENLRKRADENAQLWVIVGNSAYADFEIPTDLILAEIGSKTRWYLQEIGVLRHLHKRGSKYSPNVSVLRESVIIFSASPK